MGGKARQAVKPYGPLRNRAFGKGVADGALLVLVHRVHEKSFDGEDADHHLGVHGRGGDSGVLEFEAAQAAGDRVEVLVPLGDGR